MDNQIDPNIKKERSKSLRQLGLIKKTKFYSTFIGRELNTLIESKLRGTTDNYLHVKLEHDKYNIGDEIKLSIKRLDGEYAIAG